MPFKSWIPQISLTTFCACLPFFASAYSGSDENALIALLAFLGIVALLSILLPIIQLFRPSRGLRIAAWCCLAPVLCVSVYFYGPNSPQEQDILAIPFACLGFMLLKLLPALRGWRYAMVYVALGILLTFISGLFIRLPGNWGASPFYAPYLGYSVLLLIAGVLIYQLLRRMNAHELGIPDLNKSMFYAAAIIGIGSLLPWCWALGGYLWGDHYSVPTYHTLIALLINIAIGVLGGLIAFFVYSYQQYLEHRNSNSK